MDEYTRPVTEIIQQRFSCREYLEDPINETGQRLLRDFIGKNQRGPWNTPMRFELVAAVEQDSASLKNLGTYGLIINPTGFIVGAVRPGGKYLEDYGYAMERIILSATDLGLGTCWLGGTFAKSSFAQRISTAPEEVIPAVTSVGYITEQKALRNRVLGRHPNTGHRYPWCDLFFQGEFGIPLSPDEAGSYTLALEMVRLGPSASNKQPWRVIRGDRAWHFYLRRTRGYGNSLLFRMLKLEDLQRVDMGIAMCHFELASSELGLTGRWAMAEPAIIKPDDLTEYVASWIEQD
jgi:nitroreductase